MRIIKLALLPFLLLTIVPLAACGEDLPSAEEVIGKVIDTRDDIETAQFEMTVSLDVDAEMEEAGEPVNQQMNISAEITGAQDVKNKRMRMDIDLDMAGPDEEPINMKVAMYIIDDMLYMMVDVPLAEPQWTKMDLPPEMEEMEQYQVLPADILEVSAVEVTGTEKIKGVNSYVLEVTPDFAEVWRMMMEKLMTAEPTPPRDQLDEFPVQGLIDSLRDFAMKVYVDKDRFFVTGMDLKSFMEITPETMGETGEGKVTVDITIEARTFEINKSVTIELPPEAENAVYEPLY